MKKFIAFKIATLLFSTSVIAGITGSGTYTPNPNRCESGVVFDVATLDIAEFAQVDIEELFKPEKLVEYRNRGLNWLYQNVAGGGYARDMRITAQLNCHKDNVFTGTGRIKIDTSYAWKPEFFLDKFTVTGQGVTQENSSDVTYEGVELIEKNNQLIYDNKYVQVIFDFSKTRLFDMANTEIGFHAKGTTVSLINKLTGETFTTKPGYTSAPHYKSQYEKARNIMRARYGRER